ncbi:FUSC family protein [Salisediminibacterium halotolerans]|uniref:Uncharacterized membrane protein YgaE, UPF0421/DUF939 family n=1 Tax=Salisediminibacterium halotolerans TaxID=517425 RepID=A0A1H9VAL4_9BACI|nr:aromatic acid exporter family protein [Salisediminibacterium haloalkalitolerans]SES18277.1 Uncharacterized membrane protein YgaE, UPF0421/DUF939 family [Salisediminibacterium haloalkalitolerans]
MKRRFRLSNRLKPKIRGERIIKTGIAVFLTSLICYLLGLPQIFAVITAIVSIEPNTYDSIRKGLIRFPASAIGAGLAAVLVFFFGATPPAFALAAVLTIYLCQKLKLQDGTLVATLTAMAMIPDLDGPLFYQFLMRLLTTMIGITVATAVNVTVLPANYLANVEKRHREHLLELQARIHDIAYDFLHFRGKSLNEENYLHLKQVLSKTDELLGFQRKELRFHRYNVNVFRRYAELRQMTRLLHQAELHLGNLYYLPNPPAFSQRERDVLQLILDHAEDLRYDKSGTPPDIHFRIVNELDGLMRYDFTNPPELKDQDHYINPNTHFIYELLSLFEMLQDIQVKREQTAEK